MTQGSLNGTQLDAPISSYAVLGTRYWLGSQWDYLSGGIKHSLTQGSLDHPYGSLAWTKATCNRSSPSGYCANGQNTAFTTIVPQDVKELWFVNLYQPQPNSGGLLAFIHEEQAGDSGTSSNPVGKSRIGLAWSSDNGNTWRYLGRIISPYGDPLPLNIQGAPYIVKDGYFYVYYVDSLNGVSPPPAGSIGIGVARANVSNVIAAAMSGSTGAGLWKKYYGGGFSEPGLGGRSASISPWGITHTQAFYSTFSEKYYLPLTFMTWSGGNTSVKFYESTDALNWTPSISLADEPASSQRTDGGYQYCSVADRDGGPNAVVGQKLYLFCMKDPLINDHSKFGLYRWEVNLGEVPGAYRQSVDYRSSQGPQWYYQYGYGGSLTNMIWQGTYWAGLQAFSRIYSDLMHPGTSEMPVLKWLAPKAGTVFVGGTVRDADPSCGDGVNASLVHNGAQIFSASIANGDTVGSSPNLYRNVSAGDALFFIVSPNASNSCDSTRWDPSVTYQ